MNINRTALLYLKGMGMGAADVVPGVSGGTIAFISGIYEELLSSIRSFGPDTFKALRAGGIKAAWEQVNGKFLLPLFLGIATSVLLLVRVITWLLKNEPVLLWSFFFGLIIASVFFVAKDVKRWSAGPWLAIAVGAVVSFWITTLNPGGGTDQLWFYFIAGMLGICAMILPGISGAFILLLLGAYEPVMEAIKGMELSIITVFGIGCVAGLMSFSRVLNWLFERYHDITIAGLTGFLIGSLNKIWPWKETLTTRIAHKGKSNEELVPFLQQNVLPQHYGTNTEVHEMLGLAGADPKIIAAIGLCIAGMALLFILERFAPKTS